MPNPVTTTMGNAMEQQVAYKSYYFGLNYDNNCVHLQYWRQATNEQCCALVPALCYA